MPSWPVAPGLCLLCFLVSGQVVLLLFSDGMVQGVKGPLTWAWCVGCFWERALGSSWFLVEPGTETYDSQA